MTAVLIVLTPLVVFGLLMAFVTRPAWKGKPRKNLTKGLNWLREVRGL